MVLDDTGFDSQHKDFVPNTRVTGDTPPPLTDPDPEGHGTFMAGIIAGGGNESTTVTSNIPGSGVPSPGQFRGMAPQAGLFVQGVDPLSGPFKSDLYLQSNASFVLTGMASNNPAMPTNGYINNLSFGYQSTAYDLSAASYDLATRNAQPGVPGEHSMLFVFAAGNGSQAPGSITSPGTAKNGITVGATDSPRYITNTVDFTNDGVLGDPIFESTTFDSNEVAGFSSAGNVDVGIEGANGRFKPERGGAGGFHRLHAVIHLPGPDGAAGAQLRLHSGANRVAGSDQHLFDHHFWRDDQPGHPSAAQRLLARAVPNQPANLF